MIHRRSPGLLPPVTSTPRAEATTVPAAEREVDRGELMSSPDQITRHAQTDWFYMSEKVQAPSRSSWAICTAQYNNLLMDNVGGGKSNAA